MQPTLGPMHCVIKLPIQFVGSRGVVTKRGFTESNQIHNSSCKQFLHTFTGQWTPSNQPNDRMTCGLTSGIHARWVSLARPEPCRLTAAWFPKPYCCIRSRSKVSKTRDSSRKYRCYKSADLTSQSSVLHLVPFLLCVPLRPGQWLASCEWSLVYPTRVQRLNKQWADAIEALP
jgi:hypothetical protein